ncbi:hypothetical protein DXA08_09390 [Blautia obeum]|jgi:hypothetical protein|nr:hypothetical protein DXA08_09390 [Blautia obeum]DAQ72872.1 MAG TPA: hypothetical protein [Caudoviricetes sp.]
MVISEYCRKKLGDFLKDKVDVKEGYTYEEQAVIEGSIRILIKAGIYTLDELRKDILRECSVLLPREWMFDVANS